MNSLRISTRKSPLALWQAEHVRDRLATLHPGLSTELVLFTTQGDKMLDTSLAKVGGKGLFIKELEHALLEGRADIAVHSLKDVTVTLPEGLALPVLLEREDPRDAFVSNRYRHISELPRGARVGTASLRRQCQIRAAWPHLEIGLLRGNVNTRLAKLDTGEFDAIILATAGLKRLGFEARIQSRFDPAELLPAVGQGVVCIECRSTDAATHARIAPLYHGPTAVCIAAERAFNARLEGGCQVPIGGHAVLENGTLWLRGLVGAVDGSCLIQGEIRGPVAEAEALGNTLADELLGRGARALLDQVYGRA